MKKLILMSLIVSGAMFASAADSLLYWFVDTTDAKQEFYSAAISAFNKGEYVGAAGSALAQSDNYTTAPTYSAFPTGDDWVGFKDYTYIVELMNDAGEVLYQSNGSWTYSQLEDYMKTTVSQNPPALNVTAFNVPEPTSGLLMLLGIGLLGLKRKKA